MSSEPQKTPSNIFAPDQLLDSDMRLALKALLTTHNYESLAVYRQHTITLAFRDP
jgi:hypothetical protein